MAAPFFVSNWDSGYAGATWDSGLQWDVNVGPSEGDPAPYLDLITSEHNDKPLFIAYLTTLLQPIVDIQALLSSFVGKFDLDAAAGAQLDTLGLWIGASRNVTVPLENVFFSFDTLGQGFDEATWWSGINPLTGLVVLPDDAYRTLLRAKILANVWDGTVPGAYSVWDAMFAGTGMGLLLQDLGGMHMLFATTGPVPDAVTLALIEGGFLGLRPAGVRINYYVTPTVADTPYFGFDVVNGTVAGFDEGAWGKASPG
jgi:hypothetical protein